MQTGAMPAGPGVGCRMGAAWGAMDFFGLAIDLGVTLAR